MSALERDQAAQWVRERAPESSRLEGFLHETPVSSTLPARAPWPQALDPRAHQGLAGEFVELVGPETEADPAALLVQLLAAFGNAVGRGPGFQVGGDFHATNLYVVIVGATATGRKGMSWGAVRDLMGRADPEWTARVASGLSSGEGVIHAVRDETWIRRKAKKSERAQADEDGYISELTDAGEADKRLFCQQGEFAQVLRVMQRDGNTLSAVLRDLWDRGNARTLTKTQPGRTTGALVSVVAHVTPDELHEGLTATEQANGFANRYLYVCARRARVLPFGGDIDQDALDALAARLRGALELARDRKTLDMDASARAAWPALYDDLSAGEDGLLGAVTGRAEAQVRRLAVLYALLDSAAIVGIDHLRAAVAVWDYCHASAAHVFGAASGDPIADHLRGALEDAAGDGLSRSQIRDMLGGRVPAERIATALGRLEARGIARCDRQPSGQAGGRPTERWTVERVGNPGSVEGTPATPGFLHENRVSYTNGDGACTCRGPARSPRANGPDHCCTCKRPIAEKAT